MKKDDKKQKERNSGKRILQVPKSATKRLMALERLGYDTSSMFALSEDTVIRNGDIPEVIHDDDPVFRIITAYGTVPNNRLFRRWVASQLFRIIRSSARSGVSVDDVIRYRGYSYQWNMLVEEMRVQSVLYANDMENFRMRNRFFNKSTVVSICRDYIDNSLAEHIENKRTMSCKGRPYKSIASHNYFIEDIDEKVVKPLRDAVSAIEASESPHGLYVALKVFSSVMVHLYNGRMNDAFLKAYKASGAYFTLRNLILFHGLRCFHPENSRENIRVLDGMDEGRYFQKLMELISDGEIDPVKKIDEWGKRSGNIDFIKHLCQQQE